jgi:anti-sigma-K factor RskA
MKPADYQPFPPEAHDFVDGRLSAEAERDFERRMAANPQLREQVEQLRKAITLLRDLPPAAPAIDFDKKVIGRIREEELADRARRRIMASPRPLWQHAVPVAIGAMAASLVLALIGLPGVFETEAPVFPGSGGGEVAEVAPTEGDLLPVLCDHCERFASLRRNIGGTTLDNADLQRQLLRIELEASDLPRRQRWLMPSVADLPLDRRVEYEVFLLDLDRALRVLETEVDASSRGGRNVDMGRVRAALQSVNMPQGLTIGYEIVARAGMRGTRELVHDSAVPEELRQYAEVRAADYRHDPRAVITTADAYLANWGQGNFADQARAARVGALLRLGRNSEAARYFDEVFSRHSRDWTPRQADLFGAFFTPAQKYTLFEALRALPPG